MGGGIENRKSRKNVGRPYSGTFFKWDEESDIKVTYAVYTLRYVEKWVIG